MKNGDSASRQPGTDPAAFKLGEFQIGPSVAERQPESTTTPQPDTHAAPAFAPETPEQLRGRLEQLKDAENTAQQKQIERTGWGKRLGLAAAGAVAIGASLFGINAASADHETAPTAASIDFSAPTGNTLTLDSSNGHPDTPLNETDTTPSVATAQEAAQTQTVEIDQPETTADNTRHIDGTVEIDENWDGTLNEKTGLYNGTTWNALSETLQDTFGVDFKYQDLDPEAQAEFASLVQQLLVENGETDASAHNLQKGQPLHVSDSLADKLQAFAHTHLDVETEPDNDHDTSTPEQEPETESVITVELDENIEDPAERLADAVPQIVQEYLGAVQDMDNNEIVELAGDNTKAQEALEALKSNLANLNDEQIKELVETQIAADKETIHAALADVIEEQEFSPEISEISVPIPEIHRALIQHLDSLDPADLEKLEEEGLDWLLTSLFVALVATIVALFSRVRRIQKARQAAGHQVKLNEIPVFGSGITTVGTAGEQLFNKTASGDIYATPRNMAQLRRADTTLGKTIYEDAVRQLIGETRAQISNFGLFGRRRGLTPSTPPPPPARTSTPVPPPTTKSGQNPDSELPRPY